VKKGWRNDPAWIAHYAQVAKERQDSRVAKFALECRLSKAEMEMDAALKSLKTHQYLKLDAA